MRVFTVMAAGLSRLGSIKGDAVMKARFARSAAPLGRVRRASTVGFLLTLLATGSASAQQGTPEPRKARTPDVQRLCAGEIPNAKAIATSLGGRG
jgi:hypothetical protein